MKNLLLIIAIALFAIGCEKETSEPIGTENLVFYSDGITVKLTTTFGGKFTVRRDYNDPYPSCGQGGGDNTTAYKYFKVPAGTYKVEFETDRGTTGSRTIVVREGICNKYNVNMMNAWNP